MGCNEPKAPYVTIKIMAITYNERFSNAVLIRRNNTSGISICVTGRTRSGNLNLIAALNDKDRQTDEQSMISWFLWLFTAEV